MAFVLIGGILNGFVGHPYGDMPDHVWGNEWFAQSLRRGEWPWIVKNNLYPDGGVLWHIDPLGGIFRRAFLFLPPQWIWNFYALSNLWMLGVIGYSWALDKKVDGFRALILAILLMLNPYSAGLFHSGLSEYWGVWVSLLLAWMLEKKDWKWAGLSLALCGIQSFVMGLIGCLFVLVMAWGDFRNHKKWLWLILPSGCLVLPLGWVCLQTLSHPDALFSSIQAPGWSFQQLPAVDLYGFVSLGDWVHPDTRLMNPGIVQTHSLGWGLIPLAVYGFWMTRGNSGRFNQICWMILSMGPRLSIVKWMPLAGAVYLPLAVLYLSGSPFGLVHHPYHMVAFLFPLILPWCMVSMQRVPLWMLFGCLGLGWIDRVSGPVSFPLIRTEYSEDVSLEGARLDFPPDLSTANRRYLIQQVSHREPIAYGINQWLAPSVFADQGVQRWIRLLDDPMRRSQNRDQPPLPMPWKSESDAPNNLSVMGFEWVVLHREFLSEVEWTRVSQQLELELGSPVIQSHHQNVYRLQSSQ